jgi:hypothetical protein
LTGEALCIKAARDDLERYLLSLDIDQKTLVFSGQSWNGAVTGFRNYWQNHYICSHCHNITRAANATIVGDICRKCQEGKYTSNPSEMWNIILKHKPQKQRYFTVNDAFAALNVDTLEFKNRYPGGFFIKTRKEILHNSVIMNFKTIYKKTMSQGKEDSNDNIKVNSIGKSIIEIGKRNNSKDVDKIFIGRSSANDIVFHNKELSRNHAYLIINSSGKKYSLVDAGSTNGTFLNNRRISPHKAYELSDGYTISFGPKTTMVYFSPEGFFKFFNAFVETVEVELKGEK